MPIANDELVQSIDENKKNNDLRATLQKACALHLALTRPCVLPRDQIFYLLHLDQAPFVYCVTKSSKLF